MTNKYSIDPRKKWSEKRSGPWSGVHLIANIKGRVSQKNISCGLSSGGAFIGVVSHQGDIRVAFHQGGP